MEQKPWYQSKTIWAGLVAVLIAVYNAASAGLATGCTTDPVGLCINLPIIPEWVFALLGAFGIYSRSVAKTTIQ